MNSIEPDNQFFRKGDKKILRLLLQSWKYDTLGANNRANFQDVTFPLDEIPNHVLNDIMKNDEIELKAGWFKIINFDTPKPFMITLDNVNQNRVYSTAEKASSKFLTYGEYSYQLFDWEGIPGVFTSDYSFLRNRSLRVKFVDPETETPLSNTHFSTTNNVTYVLSLLIVYK